MNPIGPVDEMLSPSRFAFHPRHSLHPHNDLPLGPTLFEIGQGFLRLIERKYPVYHRPDLARLEKPADFRELSTVRTHPMKRIARAFFVGLPDDFATQQT
jgi:hypothetical protein